MTQISLRRAAALQEELRKAIAAAKPRLAIDVSIWDKHFEQTLGEAREKAEGEKTTLRRLRQVLYAVRRKTGEANSREVNGLLTDIAELREEMAELEQLAGQTPAEDAEILRAKFEREQKREPAQAFRSEPRDTVSVSLVTATDIEAAQAELVVLKRKRVRLQDQLVTANASLTISLSAEEVEVLEAAGLI